MAKKQIHLNAFEMNTINHLAHGLWTHPKDTRIQYKSPEYWINLAQLLEKGLFDSLFLADVAGVYDTYQNSQDPAIRRGMQVPINDPAINVGLMLGATKHLGFALSTTTSYEDPFNVARRFSTLDHLSNGRVGWNVVTSALESAAKNHGHDEIIKHDQRYEIAEEFLDVCYKLWEHSWDEDAVVIHKDTYTYSDPNKVHKINHEGTYFKVQGPHLCEPSKQRTPVIFQAGSSSIGQKFAAQHAEGVFVGGFNPEKIRNTVNNIKKLAIEVGRSENAIKFFGSMMVITGHTEAEVQEKLASFQQYYLPESSFIQFSGSSGIDIAAINEHEQYAQRKTEGNQTTASLYSGFKDITVADVKKDLSQFGSRTLFVAGTPEKVVDQIEQWIEETNLDGFNVYQAITPDTLKDFVELIVPELQKRGLYRTSYNDGSFRDRLFGQGDHLPQTHPAKKINLEYKEL